MIYLLYQNANRILIILIFSIGQITLYQYFPKVNHTIIYKIMQKSTIALLLLFLCVGVTANIWDNIFSQTQGGVPLRFSKSFSGQYENKTTHMIYQFDYNHDMQLATFKVSINEIINIPIATIQLELRTMVWTLLTLTECHRYQVQFFKSDKPKQLSTENELYEKFKDENFPTSSKQTFISSASNLLFKYIGKKQDLYLYKFQYDLLDKKPQINGEDFPQPVIAIGQDGMIIKAYTDDTLKTQIPIELISKVQKPVHCKAKVQSITVQQLEDLGKKLVKIRAQNDFKFPF